MIKLTQVSVELGFVETLHEPSRLVPWLMRIELLGTGGYHPNELRHTMCVFIPKYGIVFDAGTSFFRVPDKLQTKEISVFLSHAHLDHIVGLTYCLVAIAKGEIENVSLHGTPKTLQAIRKHLFAEPLFPVVPDYNYHELQNETAVGGGGILTHTPLKHPGGSTGYRIDWPGKSLAYITDTSIDADYADFIRGVDLLIHECYFDDDRKEWAQQTGHCHITPVMELARDANVGQIALIHFDPEVCRENPYDLEAARVIFPNTIMATDNMVIEI